MCVLHRVWYIDCYVALGQGKYDLSDSFILSIWLFLELLIFIIVQSFWKVW